jgi:hypothetical protein
LENPGWRSLKDQLAHEGVTRIEFRCSPYHENGALYPIIEHLQRGAAAGAGPSRPRSAEQPAKSSN